MKKLFIALIILCAFAACDKKTENPVADTMMDSYQKGKQAGETGDLDSVKKAVQAYHATNDKYPQKLEEISHLLNAEVDFSKYNYSPENGAITLKSH